MVEFPETQDPLTEKIIGCAIEVHRVMGPGLLESNYEAALAIEMEVAKMTSLPPPKILVCLLALVWAMVGPAQGQTFRVAAYNV